MNEDLTPVPELLPPIALLEPAPKRMAARTGMAGLALLVVLGAWHIAPSSFALAVKAAPAASAALRPVAGPTSKAPAAVMAALPNAAAGQPAVLAALTGDTPSGTGAESPE
jgi:hypothetical protein